MMGYINGLERIEYVVYAYLFAYLVLILFFVINYYLLVKTKNKLNKINKKIFNE